ncbi:MAG: ribbon-helix-helix protein, CopG family [Thermosphaera sp.]
MVKEVSVKLSEDIYEKLEKVAEKTGKSKSDIIREAVLMYIGAEPGEKTVESSKSYTKPALYSGRCSKCGKEIQQGEIAGFIKVVYSDKTSKTFVYCLDCYNSLSDKTIVSLELKKHRLKRVVTALERQVSRLLSVYDELEKVNELYTAIRNYVSDLSRYLEQVYHSRDDEARKLIEKLVFELSELNNRLADFTRLVELRRKMYTRALQLSTRA